MKTIHLVAVVSLLISVALPKATFAAEERTYLDIGSPDFHPLPLAIAKFQGQGAAEEIAKVLTDDLALSGLFEVLDPKSFLAEPDEGFSAPTIRFTRWADVGAAALLKAAVKKSATELSCEFHLYEVKAGKEVLAKTVIDKPANARVVAHKVANEIFQFYTREQGIFLTRIAAIRKAPGNHELLLFDVDGKGRELVHHDSAVTLLPRWIPDGSGIGITSFRKGRADLWTVSLKNKNMRRTVSMGALTTGGAYSPDGKKMAFTASQNGNADIWLGNADGSGARRLTFDPGTDTSPTWSPDGKRIAFVSTRSGNPHVYIMNADGSDAKRLTFQGNYNQTPRWSPRGDLIAFTARDERKVFDVFTVAPDTGKIQRVTQDQGRTNEEPSWAPNGRLLVFTTDRNGRPQLVISTTDGTRQKVITSEKAELAMPAWGPFPAAPQ